MRLSRITRAGTHAIWGPLAILLLARCGGEGGCGSGGMGVGDVCPPPVYGYAQVQGDALLQDGTPVSGRDANVGCGDVVGAYSDRTDDEGRFRVDLVYAVDDTILYPFPPREADGGFSLECTASLALASGAVLRNDSVAVHFVAEPANVVPTTVQLRDAP